MGFETSKMPSSEEMAKIEKERTLSDAEFLKGGAEYKFNEEGEKRLEATGEQIEKARREMEGLAEGKTEDVEGYLRIHQEFSLPFDEVSSEELKETLKENQGKYRIYYGYNQYGGIFIEFINKKGDVPLVNIKINDIDSLRELRRKADKSREEFDFDRRIIQEEIEKLGFIPTQKNTDGTYKTGEDRKFWENIQVQRADYIKRLEEKMAKEKKEKFDF